MGTEGLTVELTPSETRGCRHESRASVSPIPPTRCACRTSGGADVVSTRRESEEGSAVQPIVTRPGFFYRAGGGLPPAPAPPGEKGIDRYPGRTAVTARIRS
jgi:hypothetical protein